MDNDIQRIKRSIDALVHLLEEWASWQQGYRMKLGYPSSSAGFASGGSVGSFEDLCDSVDAQTMHCVDAVINDLQAIHRAAILRRYGVASVFRFRDYEGVLLAAHERLMVELPRKGVIVL